MRLHHDCLILVADGRKMLLLRNVGMADAPDLRVIYGEEQPNPRDHEQKSDLAGRRPAIGTPGQASVSESDYHQQAEDEFARRIAAHINSMALRNDLGALLVVAAGKTLGQLRRHWHRETQARIVGEVDKVMTGYASDRIAAMLSEIEEPAA